MAVADAPLKRAVRVPRLLTARPELLLLLAVSAALELWSLKTNGYANTYYAGAVKSMTRSWHNFLFASFDPAGVMTVDKPPLALWIQALSARIFGFSSLSLLIPQALMTVAGVALVYDLVRRRFGRVGATVAGAALALTPITVAIGRHNNPDALLMLCCVAALWCVCRALEDGRTRWLVWAGVAVGLGFETKMAAALLVVPALAVAVLWVAPRGRIAAAKGLTAGGAALAVVGLAWPVLVSVVSNRPWISGTSDNSVWSLMFGYNGLGRLDGQAGGPGGMAGGGPGGGAGGVFGGDTGVLRLLDQSLGGQAGWLLGFALVAAVALTLASRLKRDDARTGWVIAVGGCFATCAVAFSAAKGIFHPYYVSQLAPFTAALVGAGVAQLARPGTLMRLLAPVALVAGVGVELVVIDRDATDTRWAIPLIVVAAAGAIFALLWRTDARSRLVAVVVAVAALLAAPASWALQTPGHATQGTFPAGGPASSGVGGGPGGMRLPFNTRGGSTPPSGFGGAAMAPPTGAPGLSARMGRGGGGSPFGGNENLETVIAYVKNHGGGTVAVASQQGAAEAVIAGEDVVAIGGFSGRESEVTTNWLADEVRAGKIRWVLADSGGMMQDGRTGASAVLTTVAETCRAVSVGSTTVYDCRGAADAIAAG